MKILIIDDDDLSLSAFDRSLSAIGHDCFLFNNAEDAIKSYGPDKHEIIISDVKMRPMSGIEVLKKIREINKDAIVILVTGYYEMNEALSAIKYKANAFFTKPVDMQELSDTLDSIENEMEKSRCEKVEIQRIRKEYESIKIKYNNLRLQLDRNREIKLNSNNCK